MRYLLLLLLALPLFGAERDESLFFRIDVAPALHSFLTGKVSECLFSLPAKERPTRFEVGKGVNGKPAFQIAADLPANAPLFAAAGTIFAVPKSSPVSGMTSLVARSVLDGELTHWTDHGKDTPVVVAVYSPNPEDDTAIPGEDAPRRTKQQRVYFSDLSLLVRYVKDTPDAIALLPISSFAEKELKLLPVDGIAPNMDSVLNGKYPFSTVYRILYDKQNPTASKVAEFFLRRPFALLILECGAVPLTAKTPSKRP